MPKSTRHSSLASAATTKGMDRGGGGGGARGSRPIYQVLKKKKMQLIQARVFLEFRCHGFWKYMNVKDKVEVSGK